MVTAEDSGHYFSLLVIDRLHELVQILVEK